MNLTDTQIRRIVDELADEVVNRLLQLDGHVNKPDRVLPSVESDNAGDRAGHENVVGQAAYVHYLNDSDSTISAVTQRIEKKVSDILAHVKGSSVVVESAAHSTSPSVDVGALTVGEGAAHDGVGGTTNGTFWSGFRSVFRHADMWGLFTGALLAAAVGVGVFALIVWVVAS